MESGKASDSENDSQVGVFLLWESTPQRIGLVCNK
jgi:hypothetical protein